jgi:hypothetical protein
MKKITILLLFVVSVAGLPFSQVMNRDEKTVTVTAQGWGKKVGDTLMDALKSGVETVINGMLSTPGEREKFLEQRSDFMANAERYVFDYRIKRKILQKGKRGGKKYKMIMTLELMINKEQLRKDLEERKIIRSFKELRKQLDHFTIMPFVDEKKSSEDFSLKKDLVYAKVGAYFQDRGIPHIGEEEIKKIEGYEETIALEKSSSGDKGEEDIMLQMARNTLADFYIKIIGHVEETAVAGVSCFKVSISITVYTVMTTENIASQTGYSRPLSLSSHDASISAGIEEALNSSMDDVLIRMHRFWKDYVKEGKPYKVVFYDYDLSEIAALRRVLKQMATHVKLLKKSNNIASFLIWYKGQADDLLFGMPGRAELHLKEDPVMLGNTIHFFRKPR